MRYILLSTIIFVVSCTLQATYKEIDIKASKNNDKHIKVEVKEKNEG